MKETNHTTFNITSWEEKPVHTHSDNTKIVRAAVTQEYSGAISGTGAVEYVMFYGQNGTALFVGMEIIEGSVLGKSGRFVIQHNGMFADGIATSEWSIVADSGTDALKGLTGTGSFSAGHDGTATVKFNPAFS